MTKHLGLLLVALLTLNAGPAGARTRIQDIDFGNFSYPFKMPSGREPLRKFGNVVDVRDGKAYAGKHGDSLSYVYFKVADVLYGDLTGDGRDEAAVVAIYGTGSGNFYLTNIYFYGLRKGKPVLLATLTEDDVRKDYRGQYKGGGEVVFEALEGGRGIKGGAFSTAHLADGAHCCPESVAVLKYTLKGNHIELIGIEKRKSTEVDEKMKASYDK